MTAIPFNDKERGFLTIATGPRKYIDIAVNLAKSLELTNNHITRAIITDSTDKRLLEHFHIIIPLEKPMNGFELKVKSYYYSPFKKTFFIDADSLVINNIDHLWAAFEGKPVTVLGKKVFEGEVFNVDVKVLGKELGLEYMVAFNGGVYYYEKSIIAEELFRYTQQIIDNYYKYGLYVHHGNIADEGVMSVALGKYKMEPVLDVDGRGMVMPINVVGQFRMDILKGFCEFNKNGAIVKPAIVHMGGRCLDTFFYRRESFKLKAYMKFGTGRTIISLVVNMLLNPPYFFYVQIYRIGKFIIRRKKVKFTPLMPMYRYEY